MLLVMIAAACGAAPVEDLESSGRYLTTLALRPDARGSLNDWLPYGCQPGREHDCVNETLTSDDAFVSSHTPGEQQTFSITRPLSDAVPDGAMISQVIVHLWARRQGLGSTQAQAVSLLKIGNVLERSIPLNLPIAFADNVVAFSFTQRIEMRPGLAIEIGSECWDSCAWALSPRGVLLSEAWAEVTYAAQGGP